MQKTEKKEVTITADIHLDNYLFKRKKATKKETKYSFKNEVTELLHIFLLVIN